MTNEDDGVTGTWVKYYDVFGACFEDHGQPTVGQARRKYDRLRMDASVTFAQWGVKSVEGHLTLGEFVRPADVDG